MVKWLGLLMCSQMNRFVINVFNYSASNKINFIKLILFMRKASAWKDYYSKKIYCHLQNVKNKHIYICSSRLLTFDINSLTYIDAFVNARFFSTLKRLDFNTLSRVCIVASSHCSNELKCNLCCLFKTYTYNLLAIIVSTCSGLKGHCDSHVVVCFLM